jgi:inner membrane protein
MEHDVVTKNMWKGSVSLKLVSVGVLILVLLIPTVMINSLVSERKNRRNDAVQEISSTWASVQRLVGPVITIPVRRKMKNDEGRLVMTEDVAHFLPEHLTFTSTLEPETRKRGIYKAVVYTSQISVTADFKNPSFASLGVDASDIKWDQAAVTLGFTDMKGIKGPLDVKWNDQARDVAPGSRAPSLTAGGISLPIKIDGNGSARFAAKFELKGSSQLYFAPMGKETDVTLTSPWKHPSFKGAFLPEERNVSPTGFTARWRVLHLNRNFPQQWIGRDNEIESSMFGVDLLQPVDHYSNTDRSTKYAVLFIFLTFLVYFFIEFLNKRRLHPIQYLLVGSGLVLFYLLLLSLSEHMPFLAAYMLATGSVVALLGSYTHGVFANIRLTAIVSGILLALYFFLYCLLQLEDYALLLGSAGLFAALATAMYITRKIDWYQS